MDCASNTNNEELISLCSEGNENAWKSFIDRFKALVFWAIRNKLSRESLSIEEADVDDIFQQTFSHIWCKNRLKYVKNPQAISSWLVIVSQNITADFLRKKRSFYKNYISEELPKEAASPSSNPRSEVHNKQMHEVLEGLIADLPLKERRIMTLELFYDMKHREIANIMAIPINTVSTIIARIKEDLRAKLAKRGYNA
ncbi:MAG: sigma-70 family RNA polymerase sigma factor [Candidatus Omnitrophota bacterium]